MKPLATKALAIVLFIGPFVFIGVVGFNFIIPSPRSEPEWLPLLPTSAIPMDGQPTLVPINAPRYDAWQRLPDEFIANVYARRDPVTREFKVLSAMHNLAVTVDYDRHSGSFHSACFDVRFNIDGAVITGNDPFSMSFSYLRVFPTMVADDVLFIRNVNRW